MADSNNAQGADRSIRRIDVHHHFLPQRYMRAEAERFHVEHGNSEQFSWTAEKAIDALDRAGVDFAVGSVTAPGVWTGDIEPSRRLAREWNEAAAKVLSDHPTRFGFFAPVPLPDLDGSLSEIEYALGTLGADGINFLTNYDGKWLGDPAFDPVMDELDRRKASVYVHPTFAPCCIVDMVPGLTPPYLEYPFDTTRTIVSLILSGSTTRHPNIRWIFAHGGGALTGIYGRIKAVGKLPAFRDKLAAGVDAEVRKLHYDTASLDASSTLSALLRIVPTSQVSVRQRLSGLWPAPHERHGQKGHRGVRGVRAIR